MSGGAETSAHRAVTVVSPENFTFPASNSGESLVAVQATFVVWSAPLYTELLGVPATVIAIDAFVIVKAASVTLNVASMFPSS